MARAEPHGVHVSPQLGERSLESVQIHVQERTGRPRPTGGRVDEHVRRIALDADADPFGQGAPMMATEPGDPYANPDALGVDPEFKKGGPLKWIVLLLILGGSLMGVASYGLNAGRTTPPHAAD